MSKGGSEQEHCVDCHHQAKGDSDLKRIQTVKPRAAEQWEQKARPGQAKSFRMDVFQTTDQGKGSDVKAETIKLKQHQQSPDRPNSEMSGT